jgi:hypothetical protein
MDFYLFYTPFPSPNPCTAFGREERSANIGTQVRNSKRRSDAPPAHPTFKLTAYKGPNYLPRVDSSLPASGVKSGWPNFSVPKLPISDWASDETI